MQQYTKEKLKQLGLHGEGKIRVSSSGCLGRCSQGPAMVIYPEGTWYTYTSLADVNEIIESHILRGIQVKRLLLP